MSVPVTDRAETASSYVPVQPYPVAVTSVLSQDQIASDGVLIDDATSPNAVATFRNPTKGGASEAFAIVEIAGVTQVVYVSRDSSQSTGWSVAPLPGGPNGVWPATGVAAAVTGSNEGLVDVFWDDGSALQHTWMQPDGTWVAPRSIDNHSWGALGVNYAPASGSNPAVPVVCGVAGSNVMLLSFAGPGNGWKTTTLTGSGFSASNPLYVGLDRGANGSGSDGAQATIYSGNKLFGNRISFVQGGTAAAGSVQTLSVNGVSSPVQSVFAQTDDANGNPLAFVLAGGTPYIVSRGGPGFPGTVPIPAATGTVLQAVAVPTPSRAGSDGVTLSGLTNLYVVHTAANGHNLSVIRQIGWTNNGAVPQWSPPVPIETDVDGVFPSLNPADPETVFTADAINDNALAAYGQTVSTPWRNPATGVPEWGGGPHWSGGDVRTQTTTTYDVTSYLVQATVTDANNYPMGSYPLQLTASSDCGVMIGSTNVFVNQTTPATVTTDASGEITLSVLADDFTPPSLILTDPSNKIRAAGAGGNGPVSISPGGSTQTYMSTQGVANANGSSGVLPYLAPSAQTFTPTMMSSAQAPGTSTPLFPGVQGGSPSMPASDAVTNVNNMMQLGYSPVGDTAAPSGDVYTPAPGSPAAFIINTSDPTRPAYLTFESGDAMRTAWRAQHQPRVHLFHEADHLFSDAWKGIKAGATKVADVAVDVEKGVVSMAIWVGKEATELGDFVITCVEDACNAITAVFSALESAIKDIIDFLKALFDVGHIFDTQWAFMQALNQGLYEAQGLVEWAMQQVDPTGLGSTTFFADRQEQIDAVVGQGQAEYGPQSVQTAGGSSWQPLGQPPNATTPVTTGSLGGGPATPAQITTNPQAKWLQSQFSAATKSSGSDAVDEFFAQLAATIPPALKDALDTFLEDFDTAVGDFKGGVDAFEAGFTDLGDAIVAAIKATGASNANGLQNVAMTDLIDAAHEFATGMLDFADGIAVSFLGLAQAAVQWLLDTLNGKLPDGLLTDAIQLIYDGLWDLAKVSGWKEPKGGWAPPAGSPPITGWNPQDGMQRELTYAGIVAVIGGFPFTLLYEIITGKEPFPGGTLADLVAGPDTEPEAYKWVGVLLEMIGGYVTTARDFLIAVAVDAKQYGRVITGFSLLAGLLGVLSFVFRWPKHGESWGNSIRANSAAIVMLALPGALVTFGLLDLMNLMDVVSGRSIGLVVASLFGVATLIYTVVLSDKAKHIDPPPPETDRRLAMSTGIMTAIPMSLSFLSLPAMQKLSDDMPIAASIKVLLDMGLLDIAVPVVEIATFQSERGA